MKVRKTEEEELYTRLVVVAARGDGEGGKGGRRWEGRGMDRVGGEEEEKSGKREGGDG